MFGANVRTLSNFKSVIEEKKEMAETDPTDPRMLRLI